MKKRSRIVSIACAGLLSAMLAAVPTFARDLTVTPLEAMDQAGNMYVQVVDDGSQYTGELVDGVIRDVSDKTNQHSPITLTSDQVQNIANHLNDTADTGFDQANKAIDANSQATTDALGRVFDNVKYVLDSTGNNNSDKTQDALDAIQDYQNQNTYRMNMLTNNLQEYQKHTRDAIARDIPFLTDNAGKNLASNLQTITQGVENVITNDIESFGSIAGTINQAISKDVINGVGDLSQGVQDTVKAAISNGAKTAEDTMVQTLVSAPKNIAEVTWDVVNPLQYIQLGLETAISAFSAAIPSFSSILNMITPSL